MNTKYHGIIVAVALALLCQIGLQAQTAGRYPEIPRVDVHSHFGNDFKVLDRVMELRKQVKEKTGNDLALWINLGLDVDLIPEYKDIINPILPTNIEDVLARYQNRIRPCINDFTIQDGLSITPEQLNEWQSREVEGYKIWCGDRYSKYLPPANKTKWWAVDNPANEPVFAKMEQLGMIVTSIHIAVPYQPEGTKDWEFPTDAFEYWSAVHAFEHVLDRHPGLVFVGAHMLFLCSSAEQLDYLGFLLNKYPNLFVDVTYAYPFMERAGNDYLKKFFIKFSDRLLLGTDIDNNRIVGSFWDKSFKDDDYMQAYEHFYKPYFDLFEETLDLPVDVLEKIYYKNAMKIYPHVKESLKSLGYKVE